MVYKKIQEYLEENKLFESETIQKIKNCKEERYKVDSFLFKVHLIILGNFKLTLANEVAKLLHGMYINYAEVVPTLYNLRTWIMHHYTPDNTE